MPSLVKSSLSTELANSFFRSFQAGTTQLYFLLGRTETWGNDLIAPAPESSSLYEKEVREKGIRLQKITFANVSMMAKRNNWLSGTVYDMFDTRSNSIELSDANMIVLTDDFNVYKCVFNNYNAASTIKPTATTTEYLKLADGYVWKYMKTLSTIERSRYLTNAFIPVSDVASDGFFTGTLDFNIVSGGSGYDKNNVILEITGNGNGAIMDPILNGLGEIVNVELTSGGTGYTTASMAVSVPDSGGIVGTGGQVDAVINNIELDNNQSAVQLSAVDGEISSIYVNSGGVGYTSATVEILGDGQNASITPIIEGGSIVDFTYLNRGENYNNATIRVTGDGTGFDGDVILAPGGGHGKSLVDESYADAISMYLPEIDSDLQGSLNTPDIEYRQVALIANPKDFSSLTFRGETGSLVYMIEDSSITDAAYDANMRLRLQGESDIMTVVGVEDGKLLLHVESSFIPSSGDIFDIIDIDSNITTPSALTLSGSSTITLPTVDRYSGNMIFLDNRAPFKKDSNQISNIRTLIKF